MPNINLLQTEKCQYFLELNDKFEIMILEIHTLKEIIIEQEGSIACGANAWGNFDTATITEGD